MPTTKTTLCLYTQMSCLNITQTEQCQRLSVARTIDSIPRRQMRSMLTSAAGIETSTNQIPITYSYRGSEH